MNNQNDKISNKKKDGPVFSKDTEFMPIMSARRTEMANKSASSGSSTVKRTAATAGAARQNTVSRVSSAKDVQTTARKQSSQTGTAASSAQRAPVRRATSTVASGSGDSTMVFNKPKAARTASAVQPVRKAVATPPKAVKKADDDEYFFTIDPSNDKKYQNRNKRKKAANSVLSSLTKAVIYIVFILVVSGFISYFGISIGNDVFALVKDDSVVNLTIKDDATVGDIAELLADNDVIKYPDIFRIYADLRRDKGNFVAGTYEIAYNMNYDTLLEVFKGPKVERKEVRITIPEGYTVDNIIDLFVNGYGMGTKEGFIDVIQNYDFDYWFVKELVDLPSDRKYRLEGYLYPDTYDFYTDWSEAAIVAKFLDNFNKKFDLRYRDKCKELGMTVDEIVTLASIIQMEAKYDIEYELISSVFHNRMKNRQMTNGKLESDATIQYILAERNEDLTKEEMSIDSRYNSYLYAGLPPGPITNPTTITINYALFPAKTNYYFFVAQSNGYSLFASTNAEHEANKLIALGKK